MNVENVKQEAGITQEELIQYKQLVDELKSSMEENVEDSADMDKVLKQKVTQLNTKIIELTNEKQDGINKCTNLEQVVRTLKVNIILLSIQKSTFGCDSCLLLTNIKCLL